MLHFYKMNDDQQEVGQLHVHNVQLVHITFICIIVSQWNTLALVWGAAAGEMKAAAPLKSDMTGAAPLTTKQSDEFIS